MVEHDLAMVETGVRFPLSAPIYKKNFKLFTLELLIFFLKVI